MKRESSLESLKKGLKKFAQNLKDFANDMIMTGLV